MRGGAYGRQRRKKGGHTDLHWLDMADRVWFKLAITDHRCLYNKAPNYLTDCCVAVSDIAGRQRPRSAHRRQLDVSRYKRTQPLGRPVAGPTVWNMLPDEIKDKTENTIVEREKDEQRWKDACSASTLISRIPNTLNQNFPRQH